MADNVTTQSATPATIPASVVFSTDDVGGVQYPRTKVSLGADGAAADWRAGQQAAANSAPVVIASDQTAVPVSGTVAVSNLAATQPTSATDGANVTQGTTTDAAVTTDAAGTLSAKLRGLVKLWIAGLAAGEAHIGAVGGNSKVVEVTPTLTVAATYVANDYVGTSSTAMVFAAMGRTNGNTLTLLPALLIDNVIASVACELWLFDTAITPPADSAAWSISDADAAHCVAVLPFSTYYASALNSISMSSNVPLLVKCAAADTSLYGCLVTRGAPAYTNGSVIVKLRAIQD